MQSTPDGSCLLVGFDASGSPLEIRAFHVASFGSNSSGIAIQNNSITSASQLSMISCDDDDKLKLTALDPSLLTISTISLKITSNISEFSFQTSGRQENKLETPSNPLLLHCFEELWNRFPIVPTIERKKEESSPQVQSLHFVVSKDHAAFVKSFTSQIAAFVNASAKPTGDRLSSMRITSSSKMDPGTLISTFAAGDWLVGLFCLIPIQIAKARSNTFIPLKDGYHSLHFEDSILGANVEQVANA